MTRNAILLLGPTGSGKTPLGERIACVGLWGRRWAHFDFGAQMRRVVAEHRPDAMLSAADLEMLAEVLRTGVLLEDHQFPLAQRIFASFLASSNAGPDVWIVLNGLPRHVGQAEAMAAWVNVRAVVALACRPEAIAARIGDNVGGDRTGRADDRPEDIRRKLEIYGRRTAPLMDHYQQQAVPIVRIEVTAEMSEAAMYRSLASHPRPA
jgi:adenylate kinase family enzyme